MHRQYWHDQYNVYATCVLKRNLVMLSNKSKFYLTLVSKLKPSPSFFFIYTVIWFLWHNDFVTTLISTQADITSKIQAAMAAVPNNQFLVVLFLTIGTVLLLNIFDYLKDVASENEDTGMVELLKNSNTSATEGENDIKYVVATLGKTKKKLSDAIARENKLSQDKTELVSKLLKIEYQLEETLADNTLLKADIMKLEAKEKSKDENVLSQT